ncbi:MAG: PQQ-binding-like beta-propeller repeat protein [Verrucomicrobia bacterium]|nr:PQQ-binding-like beta-propeller repeat protein [Verrucomicrobiota bacterium]MCF7707765.1 PQQ-binding-like beta-propeller repeat protein [Verrucomicrobiota bacterium]
MFLIIFVAGTTAESQLSGQAEQAFPSEKEIRANWPAFRGPFGNAHAFVDSPPLHWNGEEDKNIRWKTPVPLPGHNSPVVWDERVYLSGADEEIRMIYCINAESGDLHWQTDVSRLPNSPDEEPSVIDNTGYATPTLTTDGTAVFAMFANGDLVALDPDGNMIWNKSLGLPDNHYGHASSLILYQSVLIVQWDQGDEQYLYGFNKQTGGKLYQVSRDVEVCWSSPICVNTGSRYEVIINANPYVMGHDPKTGAELWRIEGIMGEVVPSPAYANGMVFAVNEYAVLLGIELDSPTIAWDFERGMSEVSSLVATADYLYMGTSYGSLYCFDAKSGETHWMHEFDEGFYSSPIIVGDRVYIMDRSGLMRVIQISDTFEVIAENPLGERGFTTPAFYKDRIYIRGDEHLFCIQE